jgi:dihydrofolate reductase
MRKLIASMMVSLDGFIEGPNKELDWFVDDDELFEYFHELLDSVDMFLYGRVSYQLMVSYWPSAIGKLADQMNAKPKIVFSRTLEKVEWNSRLVKDNLAVEVTKLKQQHGKPLALFAGADMLLTLRQLGFIDEYRVMINPVVLGGGTPLFKGVTENLKLKLLKARTFKSGVVGLHYEPERNE